MGRIYQRQPDRRASAVRSLRGTNKSWLTRKKLRQGQNVDKASSQVAGMLTDGADGSTQFNASESASLGQLPKEILLSITKYVSKDT